MTASLNDYTPHQVNNALDLILNNADGIPWRRIGAYIATAREINGAYVAEIVHRNGSHETTMVPTYASATDAMEAAARNIEQMEAAAAEMPERTPLAEYVANARRANEDGDLAC